MPKPTISNISGGPMREQRCRRRRAGDLIKIIGKTCLLIHLSVDVNIGLTSVVVLERSPQAFGVREPGDHLRVLLLLQLLLLLRLLLHLLLGDEVWHHVLGIHLIRLHAIGHNTRS